MQITDSVIAVFPDHLSAETAVKKLMAGGFAVKNLTIMGKGYHTNEKVTGFYNAGDRIKFWGGRGAFWGALWGLFFGGVFLTAPIIGPLIALGYLGSIMIPALESALVFGGLSALGAALVSIGVPKDSVLEYQTAIAADDFLVMAHGSADEIIHAKAILEGVHPTHLTVHQTAALETVA